MFITGMPRLRSCRSVFLSWEVSIAVTDRGVRPFLLSNTATKPSLSRRKNSAPFCASRRALNSSGREKLLDRCMLLYAPQTEYAAVDTRQSSMAALTLIAICFPLSKETLTEKSISPLWQNIHIKRLDFVPKNL